MVAGDADSMDWGIPARGDEDNAPCTLAFVMYNILRCDDITDSFRFSFVGAVRCKQTEMH
jgi:hypothetical protein